MTEREEIVAMLRQAIDDGYAWYPEADGKCAHGTYQHEECTDCFAEHMHNCLSCIEDGAHIGFRP